MRKLLIFGGVFFVLIVARVWLDVAQSRICKATGERLSEEEFYSRAFSNRFPESNKIDIRIGTPTIRLGNAPVVVTDGVNEITFHEGIKWGGFWGKATGLSAGYVEIYIGGNESITMDACGENLKAYG